MRWRLRLFGVLGLLISPFVLVALLMYFFFKYGEQVKNSPGKVFGVREWSPLARWKFRDFNELPHLFEMRLKKSYDPANTYVDYFESYPLILLARFLSFILGSFVAVLLLGAVYDEQFLFLTHIGSRSALVVLGLLGTILAALREFIPPEHKVIEPNKIMLDIATHTHYLPNHWVDSAHTTNIQGEFFTLYPYRAVLWLTELAGIVVSPIIMIISLPSNAEQIVEFFREYTEEETENVPMCKFGSFDVKQLANIDYVPPTQKNVSSVYKAKPGKQEVEAAPEIVVAKDDMNQKIPAVTVLEGPAVGNLRKRREDSLSFIQEEDSEEEDKEKGKEKGMILNGTQSIKELFNRDKKSKKDTDSLSVRLDPPLRPSGSKQYTSFNLFSSEPSKYGKMEMSLLNFKSSYPKWNPEKNETQKFIDDSYSQINAPGAFNKDPSGSQIFNGDYSTMALMRDVAIEMEETQKENLQRSLLLVSSSRIMSKQSSY
uniref:Autophagy-related protein 9 n=1 Tax=Arcella intermedia TaxID=1963864 RepID=A0A6B2L269_9EUKA